MSITSKLNRADVKRLTQKLGPALTTKPLQRFFKRVSIVVQTRARQNAPVNTGRLRASIAYEVDTSSPPEYAKVGTNVFYAPYMEYGTGLLAHKGPKKAHWPPSGALDTWARRHGILSGFLVARAIGRRGGLKPRLYLTTALEDSRGDIRSELHDTGREMLAIWNRGTK